MTRPHAAGTYPGVPPASANNAASRLIMYADVTDMRELAKSTRLANYAAIGIGGISGEMNSLYGLGGNPASDFSGNPATDFTQPQYAWQNDIMTSGFVAAAQRYGLTTYLGGWMINLNTNSYFANWFDDAGWTAACTAWANVAGAANLMGMNGIIMNGESAQKSAAWNYTGIPWTPNTPYPQYAMFANGGTGYMVTSAYKSGATFGALDTANTVTKTQAQVAAQAAARGNQLMTALVVAFPGLDILDYLFYFNGAWESQVQIQVNGATAPYSTWVQANFWDGMTQVAGYGQIRWIDAAFYNGPQVGSADLNTALKYNANGWFAFLSQTFANWTNAADKVNVSPFIWLDGNPGEQNIIIPSTASTLLTAYKNWGMGGCIANFCYNALWQDATFPTYTLRGNWAANTNYNLNDMYVAPNNSMYQVTTAYRSGGTYGTTDTTNTQRNTDYYYWQTQIGALATPAIAQSTTPTITITSQSTTLVSGNVTDDFAVRVIRYADDIGNSGALPMTYATTGTPGALGMTGQQNFALTPAAGAAHMTITAENIHGLTSTTTVPLTGATTPLVVQSAAVTLGANGSQLVTPNISTTTGNGLLFVVQLRQPTDTVSSVTDQAGNTWARLLRETVTSGSALEVWGTTNANPTGLSNQKITVNCTNTTVVGRWFEISGGTPSAQVDKSASAGAALSSAMASGNTGTLSAAHELALGIFGFGGGARTLTGPTFTQGVETTSYPSATGWDESTGSSDVWLHCGVLSITNTTGQSYSGTVNANAAWCAAILVLA